MMTRRRFLVRGAGRVAATVAAAPLLPRLFSAPALAQSTGVYKAIVCLYLVGGNDGNNMLVPSDAHYAEYALGRGGLALDRSSLNPLSPGTSSRSFGSHPALKNVTALHNAGNAAWLANAGPLTVPLTKTALSNGATTPAYLFSHQTQENEWQSAATRTGEATTGWAGRIADVMAAKMTGSLPMVISTSGWSLLGTGSRTLAAATSTGETSVSAISALEALTPILQQMESGDTANILKAHVSAMQSSYLQMTQTLNRVFKAGANLKTVFPTSSIGQQLQSVAQLINGRSESGNSQQIFVCTDQNYDTHSTQLQVQQDNLANLDAAIGAFASAMQEIGAFDQVTLFTMTDFARAFSGNSTGGSDHAWGNHHLIVGGAVKGGSIYGAFPSLALGGDDDLTNTGLWIPTTSGSQYAATLARWLGVESHNIASIFPELSNFPVQNLGFLPV